MSGSCCSSDSSTKRNYINIFNPDEVGIRENIHPEYIHEEYCDDSRCKELKMYPSDNQFKHILNYAFDRKYYFNLDQWDYTQLQITTLIEKALECTKANIVDCEKYIETHEVDNADNVVIDNGKKVVEDYGYRLCDAYLGNLQRISFLIPKYTLKQLSIIKKYLLSIDLTPKYDCDKIVNTTKGLTMLQSSYIRYVMSLVDIKKINRCNIIDNLICSKFIELEKNNAVGKRWFKFLEEEMVNYHNVCDFIEMYSLTDSFLKKYADRFSSAIILRNRSHFSNFMSRKDVKDIIVKRLEENIKDELSLYSDAISSVLNISIDFETDHLELFNYFTTDNNNDDLPF